MPNIKVKHIALLLAVCLSSIVASAQRGTNDSLLLGGYIVDADTFPMVFMDNVEVTDRLPRKWRRQRAKYDKLRRNVYKTYPYALIAADVLKDVDSTLAMIGDDKKARRQYLDGVEDELKARFKGELEDMTMSQGHVLVKLIDREVGHNCYHIIKELKGGFSAVVFQSIARLFSHNLKAEYDPYGEEREMEEIVREIEANYRYEYQYKLQQNRLKTARNKS